MKKVLQITVHLFPNVGGVETHLKDLISSLVNSSWKVFVLAYQPLSTKTDWRIYEKGKNLTILRIPWIRGFFEKLVHYPIIEFIYLTPGLFLVTPFIIIFYKPDVLHAHGLLAAVAVIFWGKLFRIRTVISLHSLYTFPKRGLYHNFVRLIFKNADFILSLSKKSKAEVESLGMEMSKIDVFTYWIDLEKFKVQSSKLKAKKELGWEGEFIVLFVGRLIEEKGIKQLLQSVSSWISNINLVIIGSGLLEKNIFEQTMKFKNVKYLGKVGQDNLPPFYRAADCVIVPSTSEEGFGRVIIESLACGTPVIASSRGAIPEAMDETVGKFIDPTARDIKAAVEYFYKKPGELLRLSKNTQNFVKRRYSQDNVKAIIKAYTR